MKLALVPAEDKQANGSLECGEQIASVGATGNVSSAFLHFDIATTNILEVNPTNWPGLNLDLMLKNYVDRREFIIAHRPKG